MPVSAGKRRGEAIWRVSRIVTLPDWQGLGLAFKLLDTLGAAYGAIGKRFRNYPAHPSFVRGHRPEKWVTIKRAGVYSGVAANESSKLKGMGGRPCAIFEYIGPKMDRRQAELLIAA